MKKMLVVVDYQNDFVDGSLGFDGAEKLDKVISEKIRKYRAEGAQISFTMDTHGEDYLQTQEGKNLPVTHCIEGTKGWELYGETAKEVRKEDIIFKKPAFGSSELFLYALKEQFDVVEVCGLVSNICVLSNAVMLKAANPECRVIVDSRATDCMDKQQNAQALDCMRGVQIEVI